MGVGSRPLAHRSDSGARSLPVINEDEPWEAEEPLQFAAHAGKLPQQQQQPQQEQEASRQEEALADPALSLLLRLIRLFGLSGESPPRSESCEGQAEQRAVVRMLPMCCF
jgi:hypothetical protein